MKRNCKDYAHPWASKSVGFMKLFGDGIDTTEAVLFPHDYC